MVRYSLCKKITYIRFFNKLKDIKKYTWYHFEHILYLNYLYLYHNFIFVNISTILEKYPSLESFYTTNTNKLIELNNSGYIFSWITQIIL